MCGRITLTSEPHQIAERFFLDLVPDLAPSFNIAPGREICAILPNPDTDGRLVRMFNWGLKLPWLDNRPNPPKLINARSETVQEKPAFREAFGKRRCIIPIDGFYEWQKRGDDKQPFYFSGRHQSLLAVAGLWESHEYPGNRRIDSCTILTCEANRTMRPVHHRMPVILPEKDWSLWLDLEPEQAARLQELLIPAAADILRAWPVTRQVNRPAFDEPACIEPIWDDPDGQMNLFG